jgi:hypothetical protein
MNTYLPGRILAVQRWINELSQELAPGNVIEDQARLDYLLASLSRLITIIEGLKAQHEQYARAN